MNVQAVVLSAMEYFEDLDTVWLWDISQEEFEKLPRYGVEVPFESYVEFRQWLGELAREFRESDIRVFLVPVTFADFHEAGDMGGVELLDSESLQAIVDGGWLVGAFKRLGLPNQE